MEHGIAEATARLREPSCSIGWTAGGSPVDGSPPASSNDTFVKWAARISHGSRDHRHCHTFSVSEDEARTEEPSCEGRDEAIQVATRRTIEAQEELSEVLKANEVPPDPVADRVVERANDLDQLVRDDADRSIGS